EPDHDLVVHAEHVPPVGVQTVTRVAAVRAHVDAHHRVVAAQQVPGPDRTLVAAGETHHHDAALARDATGDGGEGLAPHGLERDVDAAAVVRLEHRPGELGVTRVERNVRAEIE